MSQALIHHSTLLTESLGHQKVLDRPLSEYKRTNYKAITKLQELRIYVRNTTLSMLDTVEVGIFVGLHPSLININWRTN